jgi:hypothetical protein
MASTQDLSQRLEILEEKVDFVMRSFKQSRKEGVINPKTVTYNLLDLYRLAKQIQLGAINVPETPDAPESQ